MNSSSRDHDLTASDEDLRATYFEDSDMLQYVARDVPTISRMVSPGLDVLLDMDTRLPIGWTIYGWSKVGLPSSAEQTLTALPG